MIIITVVNFCDAAYYGDDFDYGILIIEEDVEIEKLQEEIYGLKNRAETSGIDWCIVDYIVKNLPYHVMYYDTVPKIYV